MTVEVSVLKNAEKIAEAIDDLTEKISAGGGTQSGTYTCSFWNIDNDGTLATDGDYAVARASLADGKPIVPVFYVWNLDQSYPHFSGAAIITSELAENSIKLWLTSTSGYAWDENGIEYFEV